MYSCRVGDISLDIQNKDPIRGIDLGLLTVGTH